MTALALSRGSGASALRLAGAGPGAGPGAGVGERGAPEQRASEWVPVEHAARAMGCSPGHLRRECQRLAAQGLARKSRAAGSRNAGWLVHRAYHPALIRLESTSLSPGPGGGGVAERSAPSSPGSASSAWLRATQAQRDAAAERAAALLRFRAWRTEPGVTVRRDFGLFAASERARYGKSYSMRQCYAWHEMCPGSDDLAGIQTALLDRRGGKRSGGAGAGASGGGSGGGSGAEAIGASAWSFFAALYLTPQKWSARKCYRLTQAHCARMAREGVDDWQWPSLRTVLRAVERRIAPQVAVYHREGAEAWDKTMAPTLAQAPDAWKVNERWDADHARLDFFVRVLRKGRWVAARPWLTAVLDWRSRRLMGWRVSLQPSAHTVQQALLAALRGPDASPGGPPALLWMDNGKDFQSAALGGLTRRERRAMGSSASRLGGAHGWDSAAQAFGILAALGIEPRWAQPYNHNGKARIERFFGWVHQDHCRAQASWCGGTPGERDRDTLAESVRDVAGLPTLEEAAASFAAWAQASNARTDHAIDDLRDDASGERLSPAAYYERCLPLRRAMRDPAALSLLEHRFTRALTVGKNGVGVTFRGKRLGYGQHEPALAALKGSDARVYLSVDPADVSSARVYDASMRLLCVAALNGSYGGSLSQDAVHAGLTARREARRRVRQSADVYTVAASDVDAAMAEQRRMDRERTAAQLAASGLDCPAPVRIVGTPLDGQAERVERAEMRLAAGAEHASHDAEPRRNLIALLAASQDDDADAGVHPPHGRFGALLGGGHDDDDDQGMAAESGTALLLRSMSGRSGS